LSKDQEEEDDEDAPLAKRSKKRVVEDDEDDDDDDEDEDDDDDDDDEEEEEEDLITQTKLRYRPKNAAKEKAREIVRKSEKEVVLNAEEDKVLAANPKVFDEVMRRRKKRETTELRKQEIEDSPKSLAKKCERMAKTIQKAKNLIVYTGAGISTAANIPDYRGPNGVWTCLDQGRDIATCDLAQAEPTFTHMSLLTLFKKGKLKHIVSQNCDGLHLRSGIPRYALSELHGNMFIEVCKHCKPMRPYLRLFDVTERTSKHKHNTMRRCHVCGNSLIDTIVHFGERGSIKWPINWDGASKAAEKADVIICFGSSLKVLRRYPWLWCMDRPKKFRPKLYIVNLQWTPKDSAATCKINGRCDDVMQQVMVIFFLIIPTNPIHCSPTFQGFTYAALDLYV
jgi:NAD-dependent deacetylase sirtuin 7